MRSQIADVHAQGEGNWPRAMEGRRHIVEAPTVVQTQQAEHRQEDAHADASGAVDVNRIEPISSLPGVSCLEESHCVNGGTGVSGKWVTEFRSVFRNGPSSGILVRRRQRQVVIAPQRDDFPPVEDKSTEEHPAEVEALKRRQSDLAVVLADDATAEIRPEHHRLRVLATPVVRA